MIMPNMQSLTVTKSELKKLIRSNSDRGFLPYSACNRVCDAMIMILENSKRLDDHKMSFDTHLFVLVEVLKLIAHADTSSGAVSDVVRCCLDGIEAFSKSAPDDKIRVMFNEVIKAVKNKVFKEWGEYGYQLLRSTTSLVQDHKQAEIIYSLFPILGTMYGGKEYPDRFIIEQDIIERLDGAAEAEQYRTAHIHIPEIRMMVVERAMVARQYTEAEKLCLEALQVDKTYGKPSNWAYYLERIYAELGYKEKQIEMVQLILRRGDRTYYSRLKALYESDGIWERHKELVLRELSEAYLSHVYAALLSEEGELARLLGVVQANPMYIEYYGKQLANGFPTETYPIYEAHIIDEAAAATDRRKYKGVCKLIKNYYGAGAKVEARNMIQRLMEKYPRRAAMVDELVSLEKKLGR